MTMKKKGKLKRGRWTKEEIRKLKKLFPIKSCPEVAKKLGRPFYAVKRKSYRMGIFKSKTYLKKIGRA
jgi:hypothetical protein